MTTGQGADRPVGTLPGGTTGEAGDTASVVRSEERARVAFPVRVRSRVRLVKRVVTEEVTHTFTLRREVLRVEEEPADGADAELAWDAPLGDGQAADDFEIVLHAEQLVTSTTVVPVERVRVSTRVVTSDVLVSTDLRREQVAVEHVEAMEQDRPVQPSTAPRGTARADTPEAPAGP